MAAGAFDNLPGRGKPFVWNNEAESAAGDNWLGFKLLRDGGYLPEWLNLGREIEIDLEALAVIDRSAGDPQEAGPFQPRCAGRAHAASGDLG